MLSNNYEVIFQCMNINGKDFLSIDCGKLISNIKYTSFERYDRIIHDKLDRGDKNESLFGKFEYRR